MTSSPVFTVLEAVSSPLSRMSPLHDVTPEETYCRAADFFAQRLTESYLRVELGRYAEMDAVILKNEWILEVLRNQGGCIHNMRMPSSYAHFEDALLRLRRILGLSIQEMAELLEACR